MQSLSTSTCSNTPPHQESVLLEQTNGFVLNPSRRLVVLFFIGLASLWVVPLYLAVEWNYILLPALCVASLLYWHQFRRDVALGSNDSIKRIIINDRNDVILSIADGRSIKALISNDTAVYSFMVVLCFTCNKGGKESRRSVLIVRDMLGDFNFKSLKRLLRCEMTPVERCKKC